MKPRKVSRRREFKFKDWEAGRKNEEESWGKKIKINSDSFENRQQFLNRISFTPLFPPRRLLAVCRRRPPPRSLRETARFRHVSLGKLSQTDFRNTLESTLVGRVSEEKEFTKDSKMKNLVNFQRKRREFLSARCTGRKRKWREKYRFNNNFFLSEAYP